MVTCDQNSLIRKNASIAIKKNTCSKQISILHSLSIKIQTIKLSSFNKNIDERVDAINFQKSRSQSDRRNQDSDSRTSATFVDVRQNVVFSREL